MTELENLTMQLQYAEQNFGENAPIVLELRQAVQEMKQERQSTSVKKKPQDLSESTPSSVLNFSVGMRKKQG